MDEGKNEEIWNVFDALVVGFINYHFYPSVNFSTSRIFFLSSLQSQMKCEAAAALLNFKLGDALEKNYTHRLDFQLNSYLTNTAETWTI